MRTAGIRTSKLYCVHYLTVQDVLWINLQVMKKPVNFQYETLEETTFYQYGYGNSQNVVEQAERFLNGLIAKKPFEAGNEATALLACAAFLALNGYHMELQSGDSAYQFLTGDDRKLHGLVHAADPHAHPIADIKSMIAALILDYSGTVNRFAEVEATVA